MIYSVKEVHPQETTSGKPWYEVVVDGNGETNKVISCFNFKPEVGKEYDLVLVKKGDYTYGNLAKTKFPPKLAQGTYEKKQTNNYPDKEERQGNQKMIAKEAIIKTIFPVVYDKKKEVIESGIEMEYWYNFFMT